MTPWTESPTGECRGSGHQLRICSQGVGPIAPSVTTTSIDMHAKTGSKSSVAGLDLHLDRPRGRLRDGVMEAIRDAIRSGRLAPGIQLPSSRVLASDLGV